MTSSFSSALHSVRVDCSRLTLIEDVKSEDLWCLPFFTTSGASADLSDSILPNDSPLKIGYCSDSLYYRKTLKRHTSFQGSQCR